jgi:hypothetical protein
MQIIQKPVSKDNVVNVLKKLGFQTLKWQAPSRVASRQNSPKNDRQSLSQALPAGQPT